MQKSQISNLQQQKNDQQNNLHKEEVSRAKKLKEVDEKLQSLEAGVSNLKTMNELIIKQSKSKEEDVVDLKKMISRLLEGQ